MIASSRVLHIPITEKISRIRTFEIVGLRQDRQDTIGQIVTVLDMLLDEKFNGTIVLNVSSGGIANVQANEISKIKAK